MKMNLNTMKKGSLATTRGAKQAGLTIVESLLVLVVIALVLLGAYQGFKTANGNVKANSQVKAAIQLAGNVTRLFSQSADYSTLTNTAMINAKYIPDALRTDGTSTITNGWGGAVTVEKGSGTTGFASAAGINIDTNYRVVFQRVPTDVCADFVSGLAPSAQELYVDSADAAGTVKSNGGLFDPIKTATKCNGATNGVVTVVMVQN